MESGQLRLIVGLGNPGAQYRHTRHNLGFLAVELLASRNHLKFQKSIFCRGLLAQGIVNGGECVLLLPQTFMNNSGQAVRSVVERKTMAFSDILVVCDDMTVDFGQLRLRRSGSHGGHNGLRSIIDCLGTREFARLRMGLGDPIGPPVDFVLGDFTARERQGLEEIVAQAADCCAAWVSQDIENVMSQFNKRKGNE